MFISDINTVFRHTYLKVSNAHGPAISWVFEIDRTSKRLRFALTVCSKGDKFCKHIGRANATMNLNEGIDYTIPFVEGETLVDQAIAHLKVTKVVHPNTPFALAAIVRLENDCYYSNLNTAEEAIERNKRLTDLMEAFVFDDPDAEGDGSEEHF